MRLQKSKKGASQTFALITTIVLLLFFLVIWLFFSSDALGKGFKIFDDQNNLNKDHDNDGIATRFDKCPCERGEQENNGCKLGYDPSDNEDDSCTKG